MRNCLYNRNYNNMNKSCCGNTKNNLCCENTKNNFCCVNQKNNLSCNNQMNNSNCNNIQNNSNCGNMRNDLNCSNTQNNITENRQCINTDLMEQMKFDLQSNDFAIQDLALYLDTHPDDMKAVCMHNQYAKKYRKLSDEYQKVYGPLNIMYPCNSWRWIEEPWPWNSSSNGCLYGNNRGVSEEKNSKVVDENLQDEKYDYELKGGIN